MRVIRLFIFVIAFCLASCNKQEDPQPKREFYFPPVGTNTWETVNPADLDWDISNIQGLRDFLQSSNTRAFIILKDGKIVIEEYFGTQLTGGVFNAGSTWYWASAGKVLTASLVGIAQQQERINIQNKSSDYLGQGWSSLTPDQENKITVRHHLTMTTGLDEMVMNSDCTLKACLRFKAEPGTRWAYHNAPYTILDKVIEAATGQTFDNFFLQQLRNKIGMDGTWIRLDYNNVYFSTARSMARFGLLLLNEGNWDEEEIISDKAYFQSMINTSQNINLAYGYLTWLNGKNSIMVPGIQTAFSTKLCPPAPDDMYAAMGKNGQIINVVPSKGIVVVRMGDAPDEAGVPFTFQNELWEILNAIIKD